MQHGQDLKKEIIMWVNSIMGTQHLDEQDIERAHFVGNPKSPRTRPVVVKVFNDTKKEQFMREIKEKQDQLVYRGTKLQILQDLSTEEIHWKIYCMVRVFVCFQH